ncbi:MAG: four-helix bundle copper-binding protein [Actinomycetota bacterium]|nr:four-helix bundle copper-binding protein [Actinomycetota bacterium]
MSYAKQMLDTYPRDFNLDADQLAGAIEAVYGCAQACTACADACLSEDRVAELIKCIQLNLNCADVCVTAGRSLSRQTEYDASLTRALLEACAQTCRSCAEECERHAEMGMEHCRVCAEACRRCEQACQGLIDAIVA